MMMDDDEDVVIPDWMETNADKQARLEREKRKKEQAEAALREHTRFVQQMCRKLVCRASHTLWLACNPDTDGVCCCDIAWHDPNMMVTVYRYWQVEDLFVDKVVQIAYFRDMNKRSNALALQFGEEAACQFFKRGLAYNPQQDELGGLMYRPYSDSKAKLSQPESRILLDVKRFKTDTLCLLQMEEDTRSGRG